MKPELVSVVSFLCKKRKRRFGLLFTYAIVVLLRFVYIFSLLFFLSFVAMGPEPAPRTGGEVQPRTPLRSAALPLP